MSRQVLDILWIEISSSLTGDKELQTVNQVTISENDPAGEVVKTMRRNRKALGHKSGISDFEVELEVKETLVREVPWKQLKDTGEIFQMRYQEASGKVGGDRYVLEDCKVIDVSRSGNAEGEVTETVKIIPLDHRQED
jgi:hypothetical protein